MRQWCLIYLVCKYSEEDCSSRGELTVSKYAAVCRIALFRPRKLTLPSLTREVRTTEDASPKFEYLVLRNTHRPNVTSPDYLPIFSVLRARWKHRQQQVSGNSGNFGGKVPYVSPN